LYIRFWNCRSEREVVVSLYALKVLSAKNLECAKSESRTFRLVEKFNFVVYVLGKTLLLINEGES